MALVLADRVRETTKVVGTGPATLLGAIVGYQSFTAVGNGNTTYYVIANQSAGEWEVGVGTYTASGTTLSRDTVLSSSNAGALVVFSAGTKDIWVDYAAGKAVTTDTLAYPPVIGNTTPNAATFTTLNTNGLTTLRNTSGTNVVVLDDGVASDRYIFLRDTGGGAFLRFNSGTAGLRNATANGVSFQTNNSVTQAVVSHTASAVNYVQVTGAATGGGPIISVQGSDSNAEFKYRTKGIFNHLFENGNGAANFVVDQTAGSSVVNRNITAGSLTGFATRFYASGSDTNISQVFQSKGTGAIDLAAGSSGVNISNGGTVTALTRTAGGSAYTSFPSVAITAPTTAGGVQATATVTNMFASGVTVQSGGTGYTAGNVLTVSGGTPQTTVQLTVSTVSAGVITAVTVSNAGAYTALPTNPVSVTGGTGSGATFNLTWAVIGFTITNAGSGYVEQPTVTFSGGGGSGAAAYAIVGSIPTVRSVGGGLSFATPSGEQVRVLDFPTGTAVNYVNLRGGATGFAGIMSAGGSDTNIGLTLSSKGTGSLFFQTNNLFHNQFVVAHTASAVNYVQVTGAATTGLPQITAQGSDTNPGLLYITKGVGEHRFASNASAANIQFRIPHTASAVNYGTATGAAAGSSPVFSVAGTDTNIDLALTPKGTGLVRFGTRTASADAAITGYIEIKDSAGTTRRLAVIG